MTTRNVPANGIVKSNALDVTQMPQAIEIHSGNDQPSTIARSLGRRRTARPSANTCTSRLPRGDPRGQRRRQQRDQPGRRSRSGWPAHTNSTTSAATRPGRGPRHLDVAPDVHAEERHRAGKEQEHRDQIQRALDDDRGEGGRRPEAFLPRQQIRPQDFAERARQES